MDRMMGQMMDSLARNPATGFRDFAAVQEKEALATIHLAPAEERALGKQMRETYLREAQQRGFRKLGGDERTRYLEALVTSFSPLMRNKDRYPQIEIELIDCPIAEGQSFPGGFLVFTTGLLASADEATVAGVVAHELAHLDLGHNFQYARRAKLALEGFAADHPADFGTMMTRGAAIGSVMMNPYRPEHELAADCQATTWLFQQGYDPSALARFFEQLHERQQDERLPETFASLRSHPYTLDRRDEVRQRLAQLKRWRPAQQLGLFVENLRGLVSRLQEQPEQGQPHPANVR
jgi:predicted Zn-dependent protease